MAEVASTFQKRPCYRYIRNTDKLPVDIPSEADLEKVVCKVKLFNPTGSGTWWIASYDPETDIAFGVAQIHEREIGSFFMGEITGFRGQFGLPIERDLYYTPRTVLALSRGE